MSGINTPLLVGYCALGPTDRQLRNGELYVDINIANCVHLHQVLCRSLGLMCTCLLTITGN